MDVPQHCTDDQHWTTLITTVDYVEGVVALCKSLLLVLSKYPLLCYITSNEELEQALQQVKQEEGLSNLMIKRIPSYLSDVAFIIYTLNLADDDEETERVKKATRAGFIALLIAIMAALDLKLAPFWLVWLTSYYLDISG